MKIPIPKRAVACHQCSKLFEEDQEIVSQLSGDYIRKDTCLDCFVPASQATTWRQKYKQKVVVKEEDSDEVSRAWELLSKAQQEEAYVLVLYLVRKKILAKRGKEGLYEHLETGEMVQVEEVNLSQYSLPEIHARLKLKLQ